MLQYETVTLFSRVIAIAQGIIEILACQQSSVGHTVDIISVSIPIHTQLYNTVTKTIFMT